MNKNYTGINGSRTNISDDESLRGDIHPSQSSILIKLPFPPI
ncbi:6160_t:CDS:1, partial [Acaulospora morrowiae]